MSEESDSPKLPFDPFFFRVNAVPSHPLGEKVADRPDEGAFVEGSVLKVPLVGRWQTSSVIEAHCVPQVG